MSIVIVQGILITLRCVLYDYSVPAQVHAGDGQYSGRRHYRSVPRRNPVHSGVRTLQA